MSTAAPITGTTYPVELLFDRDLTKDDGSVYAELARLAAPSDFRAENGSLSLFHKDVPIAAKDATLCAQTVLLRADKPFDPASLASVIAQTRDWPAAESVIARAQQSLLVTDMMSSSLAPAPRLAVFQRALRAIVMALRPIAIHWAAADKLVEPSTFLAAMEAGEDDRIFTALNVRLFRVGNRPGECVMDTMGLAFLGLPDLQVHFHGDLDPQVVARHLFNSARYVFLNGDVIGDGHTIDGALPGQKWRCQHEDALVGPPRVVVDLDPGPPHAAGNRG